MWKKITKLKVHYNKNSYDDKEIEFHSQRHRAYVVIFKS